ncbi:sugar ABC transporter ATP-binding protein [Cryobacterium sp. 10C2]|uniref:sugar ABC transporter ATP-binding protein n=1 Tax=Cryobacterium sp. 10C2 TaxID=3048576 RepID=UPI002AB3F538|nr:sugar ABC transporter ATP-binding protein [Cryobacterium sp. 10C2]MDY7526588.1 sugar ABC transporter ATP-binding protein [Cryobacterium sp. 10C2]MEB0290554.1 sugar ABC transporter ATP-binding protein [Cryobacterium sp. 10C2]
MNDQAPYRLKATGITKSYGAVNALADVHFELRPGEVMALLGENGAGKSTIVKVISGLIIPDEGEITIDGQVVQLSSVRASQDAGIAVVQQEFSTVGSMSVAENLVLGQNGAPVWWNPQKLNAQARNILARVGLEDIDPRRSVDTLSVAEMQLLEIARVLAKDAKIVIFDEPTAALSDAEIVRVLDAVKRLAREGRSVIYVTHRLGEVFEIADRVTIFRNGRSAEPQDVADLTVDRVVEMMIGRELGHLYPEHSHQFGPAVLETRGLKVPGINGEINLTVRRGEILGLTGQLGSGASEIMKAISGTADVLAGEVLLDGERVDLHGRRRGIIMGIAYCSPDRKKDGIFAGVSIRRNLSSPWLRRVSRLGFVSRGQENSEATRSAANFAIDVNRLNAFVGNLSGGNQQKVAVGKWLGIRPRVLLVEEPTRGVDIGARAEIYAQLRRLCDSGVGVIVTSSDTNEILGLSDTIATYYRGTQTAYKPVEEWTEPGLVREVMHREVQPS